MLTLGSTFRGLPNKRQKATPAGKDSLKDLEAIEKAYKNQIRLD